MAVQRDEAPLLRGRDKGVVQPGEEKLWDDLTAASLYLEGSYWKDEARLFTEHVVTGKGEMGSEETSGVRSDFRGNKKKLKVVRPWHRFP